MIYRNYLIQQTRNKTKHKVLNLVYRIPQDIIHSSSSYEEMLRKFYRYIIDKMKIQFDDWCDPIIIKKKEMRHYLGQYYKIPKCCQCHVIKDMKDQGLLEIERLKITIK